MSDKTTRDDGALGHALTKLKQMIVTGDLMPGEQIRQQEVATELGVSRVPLREALNVLAQQGHLLHKPHQGYFVVKRKSEDLAQLRWMLEMLENELMRTLEWPNEACLEELVSLHDQMLDTARQENWYPLLALNQQFHFTIFELSPYKLVLDQVSRLWELTDPSIATKLSSQEARLQTCLEHAQLIEALRRQDREASLEVLNRHRTSTSSGMAYELVRKAK